MTKKLVCGFGINDADYVVQRKYRDSNGKRKTDYCPYYRKWQNMVERCYSNRCGYSTYSKTFVCEEWKYFSNFKSWMETKDWEGKYLDKDLLGDGTLYSPETCCFIDNQTNVFIRESVTSKQGLFKGVHKDLFPKHTDNHYLIYCQDVNLKKRLHIGYSNTEERASRIYKSYLNYFGNVLSKRYADPVVSTALRNLAGYEEKEVEPYILYFQEKVLEFNKMFGNNLKDKSLVDVYRNLTDEEINGKKELLSSYADKDWEGVLDGICDTIFTGFMFLNLLDEAFKGESFIPVTDIKGINRYDFKLLAKSFEEGEYLYFKNALINLISKLCVISDVKAAFDRVYLSNMSKALNKSAVSGEKYLQDLINGIEKEGRYSDLWWEDVGDYIVIKAGKDSVENKEYPSGKIMKGSWYKSVEDLGGLEEFLY